MVLVISNVSSNVYKVKFNDLYNFSLVTTLLYKTLL